MKCKACGELETYRTLFCVDGSFIVEQDEEENRAGETARQTRVEPEYGPYEFK